jgi:hypothetical protein
VIFRMLAVRNTARFADAVLPPDGDLRQDWQIATGLAQRLRRLRGGAWGERLAARALDWLGPTGVLDLGLRLGRSRLSVSALRASPSGVDLGPLRPMLARAAARGLPARPVPPRRSPPTCRACSRRWPSRRRRWSSWGVATCARATRGCTTPRG